jgi:hypothetical protein
MAYSAICGYQQTQGRRADQLACSTKLNPVWNYQRITETAPSATVSDPVNTLELDIHSNFLDRWVGLRTVSS